MIEDLQAQLEKTPENNSIRLELVEAYIYEGYWDEITHVINEVPNQNSHKTLRQFLRPVLQMIRSQGEAQYLGPVLRLLERYDEDDQMAMKWLKKGRKDIEKRFYGGVFPPSVSYRDWWKGPHTEYCLGRSCTPGRIISLSEEKATLLFMEREDDGFLSVDELVIDLETLSSLTKNLRKSFKEGDFFEMFVSPTGDNTTFVFHTS